jgi:DNA-binding transcriptional regulator YhcF (GntR family)
MKSAEHIADRIRLLIATKQFKVGEVLPSTRDLGAQLGVSFHTVRKAYQKLVTEGLLRGEKGRGFVVYQQTTLNSKEERLEKGADRIRQLLEELISYGLDENEVESLFEEQISFMEWPERSEANAVVAETLEIAQLIQLALRKQVGIKTSVMTLKKLDEAVKYDTLFCSLNHIQTIRKYLENTPSIPMVMAIDTDVLMYIMERSASATLGLVTSDETSIPPLLSLIKNSLQLDGPVIAGSTYGKSLPLFVRETDLIIYTPAAASLVEKQLPERKRVRLSYAISQRSCERIRSELWDD